MSPGWKGLQKYIWRVWTPPVDCQADQVQRENNQHHCYTPQEWSTNKDPGKIQDVTRNLRVTSRNLKASLAVISVHPVHHQVNIEELQGGHYSPKTTLFPVYGLYKALWINQKAVGPALLSLDQDRKCIMQQDINLKHTSSSTKKIVKAEEM